MRYGVLGTGMVRQTLATRLAELGHEVMMGSRTVDNKEAEVAAANRPPTTTRFAPSFSNAADVEPTSGSIIAALTAATPTSRAALFRCTGSHGLIRGHD